VTIAALLIRGPGRFFPGAPESWSPTSLAQFVSRSWAPPNLYSALSKLDLFLFWWLAVMICGFYQSCDEHAGPQISGQGSR
jgi:hypothetical protein